MENSPSPLDDFAAIIRGQWWSRELETHLFGTTDPREIATLIDEFCSNRLGVHIGRALFHHKGVGMVSGLELTDGRAVVVKVHRPEKVGTRLAPIQQMQAHMHDAGFPAPRPLLPPTTLAGGIATVEAMLDVGAVPDGRDPEQRATLARGLTLFLAETRPLVGRIDLRLPVWPALPDDTLFPLPHDVRWDFTASRHGVEWIDELAASARARLREQAGPIVIGHFDWRVQNLRVANGDVVAVYDWDSIMLGHEPALVGDTSKLFSIDWTRGEVDPITTLEESRAFVLDYEALRDAPFTAAEWDTLDAAHLYGLAYCARCQHCDVFLGHAPENNDIGFIARLRERGERFFVP